MLTGLAVTKIKHIADSFGDRIPTGATTADGKTIFTVRENVTSAAIRLALQGLAGCAGAAAGGAGCSSGALGASASVALNLIATALENEKRIDTNNDGVADSYTLEAQQARTNLIATLTAALAGALGANPGTASTAARLETERNALVAGPGGAVFDDGCATGRKLADCGATIRYEDFRNASLATKRADGKTLTPEEVAFYQNAINAAKILALSVGASPDSNVPELILQLTIGGKVPDALVPKVFSSFGGVEGFRAQVASGVPAPVLGAIYTQAQAEYLTRELFLIPGAQRDAALALQDYGQFSGEYRVALALMNNLNAARQIDALSGRIGSAEVNTLLGKYRQGVTDQRISYALDQNTRQFLCIALCPIAAAFTPIVVAAGGTALVGAVGLSGIGAIGAKSGVGALVNVSYTYAQNGLLGVPTTTGQALGSAVSGAIFVPGFDVAGRASKFFTPAQNAAFNGAVSGALANGTGQFYDGGRFDSLSFLSSALVGTGAGYIGGKASYLRTPVAPIGKTPDFTAGFRYGLRVQAGAAPVTTTTYSTQFHLDITAKAVACKVDKTKC